MSSSIIEAMCQINGAKIAANLYPFLKDNDNCFESDDDTWELITSWECKSANELANMINEYMVEKTKGYFELNLVDIENRKYIQEALQYQEDYNAQRPDLASFEITFNGLSFVNPDKRALEALSDIVVSYGKLLNAELHPDFVLKIFLSASKIEQLRVIDKSIVEIPYKGTVGNKAYILNLHENEHINRIIYELNTFNDKWTEGIELRKPRYVILIEYEE